MRYVPSVNIRESAKSSVADIYFNLVMRDGMNSVGQIGFLTVYQILYAGRGFCFAIVRRSQAIKSKLINSCVYA
jgi:hypothetical protein